MPKDVVIYNSDGIQVATLQAVSESQVQHYFLTELQMSKEQAEAVGYTTQENVYSGRTR